MKINIITLILILLGNAIIFCSTELPRNDLIKLRSLLYNSTNSEDSLDSLFKFISILNKKNDVSKNPLLLAYSGVGKALLAKYSFFPWDKLSHVNNGLRLMNKAVDLDINNLEIRFLRFSVLSNIPSFLGYSSEANQEANVLYEMLKYTNYKEDAELIKNVVQFLINSERLDENKQKYLSQTFNVVINQ